jgi:hypothetical protein
MYNPSSLVQNFYAIWNSTSNGWKAAILVWWYKRRLNILGLSFFRKFCIDFITLFFSLFLQCLYRYQENSQHSDSVVSLVFYWVFTSSWLFFSVACAIEILHPIKQVFLKDFKWVTTEQEFQWRAFLTHFLLLFSRSCIRLTCPHSIQNWRPEIWITLTKYC